MISCVLFQWWLRWGISWTLTCTCGKVFSVTELSHANSAESLWAEIELWMSHTFWRIWWMSCIMWWTVIWFLHYCQQIKWKKANPSILAQHFSFSSTSAPSIFLSFSILWLIIFDLHREHFDPLSEQWAVFRLKAQRNSLNGTCPSPNSTQAWGLVYKNIRLCIWT